MVTDINTAVGWMTLFSSTMTAPRWTDRASSTLQTEPALLAPVGWMTLLSSTMNTLRWTDEASSTLPTIKAHFVAQPDINEVRA